MINNQIIGFDTSDFEVIIFDMDGTMIDNMMVHHYAWQQKLKELGMDLPIEEVMQKVHGVNKEILKKLFGDKLSEEELIFHANGKEEIYRKNIKHSLRLIDGLETYLQDLRSAGIRLAIGSAAPPENVNFALDILGVRPLFEVILHAENVTKGKPDPEIYLSIMEEMQVPPQSCLIFEDSPVGAQAAMSSGAQVVVITTTHNELEFNHLPIMAFIQDYNFKK